MAVEDMLAAEDIKVVVVAEVAATTATTTTTIMGIKEAAGTTIKGLHSISIIKGTKTKMVVVTETIIKDPLKAKAEEESIFTREGEMFSTILKWVLEP